MKTFSVIRVVRFLLVFWTVDRTISTVLHLNKFMIINSTQSAVGYPEYEHIDADFGDFSEELSMTSDRVIDRRTVNSNSSEKQNETSLEHFSDHIPRSPANRFYYYHNTGTTKKEDSCAWKVRLVTATSCKLFSRLKRLRYLLEKRKKLLDKYNGVSGSKEKPRLEPFFDYVIEKVEVSNHKLKDLIKGKKQPKEAPSLVCPKPPKCKKKCKKCKTTKCPACPQPSGCPEPSPCPRPLPAPESPPSPLPPPQLPFLPAPPVPSSYPTPSEPRLPYFPQPWAPSPPHLPPLPQPPQYPTYPPNYNYVLPPSVFAPGQQAGPPLPPLPVAPSFSPPMANRPLPDAPGIPPGQVLPPLPAMPTSATFVPQPVPMLPLVPTAETPQPLPQFQATTTTTTTTTTTATIITTDPFPAPDLPFAFGRINTPCTTSKTSTVDSFLTPDLSFPFDRIDTTTVYDNSTRKNDEQFTIGLDVPTRKLKRRRKKLKKFHLDSNK